MHYPIRIFWYRTKEGIFMVDFYKKQGIEIFYNQLEKGIKNRLSYSNFIPVEQFIAV